MHPNRRWVLTSISLDKKQITTATFDAGREAQCLAWLEQHGADRNIYFAVNPPDWDVAKKCERTDIPRVVYLHVDIDPRAGEDIAAEQQRALGLLQNPPGIVEPTCIVSSGGGLQGFWALRDPIVTDCKLELAEDAKLYNLAIELALGADHVHNLDRIMRLPGTINRPDAKKAAKGRQPALAEVVEWHQDRVYAVSQFTKAAAPATDAEPATPVKPRVRLSGKGKRLASLDELPPAVSDRVKVIIAQGRHPDEPPKKGDDSRSAWLFDAVCALVRARVDDDTIYAIITDPQFRISESVLDKGSGTHKYAIRQIREAKAAPQGPSSPGAGDNDDADKPGPRDLARALLRKRTEPLIHLNDEYHSWRGGAYATREDNSVRSEAYNFLESVRAKPTGKFVSSILDALVSLVHLDRADFRPPCWANGKPGPDPRELLVCRNGLLHLPTGRLLPHDSDFITFNALDYDYAPEAPEPTKWLAFLKEIWPGADEADCIAALQHWFGYLLAPDTAQQKILVLVGPKRSGKGTIARILTSLLGQHNVCAPRLSQFGEQFGLQPLIGKQVAMVSDMRLSGRADKAAIAEALLTISGEDYVSIPRKNMKDWEGRLRTRFVVMSNEPPTISDPSGALPGRYIVLQMRQSFYGREDTTLTDRLLSERSGILNWAIAGWHALQAAGRLSQPQSSVDTVRQIERGSSEISAFVEDCCEFNGEALESKDDLYQCFVAWTRDEGITHCPKKEQFAKDLFSAFGDKIREVRPRTPDGKARRKYGGIRIAAEVRGRLLGRSSTPPPAVEPVDLPF
jgi:P4 family phage/plasmid primase-like protien